MNKALFLYLCFWGCSYFTIRAQETVSSSTEDAVYLKNGTILRGKIIENKEDHKHIRIKQTVESERDTILFCKREDVIQIKQNVPLINNKALATEGQAKSAQSSIKQNLPIEKQIGSSLSGSMHQIMQLQAQPMHVKREKPIMIEREKPTLNYDDMLGEKNDVDLFSTMQNKRYRNRWFRQINGLRMFVDQGLTLGIGQNANNRLDWYVSGGYQLDPIFYVGGGMGYSLSLNKLESSAPVFINPRINFLDENTTPYLDVKGGYSFLAGKGLYLSIYMGLSFAKGRKAFNIGAGYSFQRANFKETDKENPEVLVPLKSDYHGISLKMTYEF